MSVYREVLLSVDKASQRRAGVVQTADLARS